MTATPPFLTLPIEGMSCAACSMRVEKALQDVPGVRTARVNLATGTAQITGTATHEALIIAVEQAGYSVPTPPIQLKIGGMSCAACSVRVEKTLKDLPGVRTAHVNLTTGIARITGTAPAQTLIHAVRQTGFEADAIEQNNERDAIQEHQTRMVQELRNLKRDLLFSFILWLIIMAMEHGPALIPTHLHAILQWALASIALLGPGRRFYKAGIPALLRRHPNMNSLVSLGTGAAYLYSSLVVFFPSLMPEGTQHLYFESVLSIITLVLLGRFLEARAKGRTSAALEKLTRLQPQEAHLLTDGQCRDVPIAQIQPDDLLLIRPGERVPLDGVILEGESHLDESLLTGEPMPTLRRSGDMIIGGTVNQEGALTVRATATGADTMLARIISMVAQAQAGKLPIQSLVDKVTLWFVPAIILLAALTFCLWLVLGPQPALGYAVANTIAVLIAACPCAMGLATPTAIMVGTGKAAEMGILFRKGEALQTLGSARLVAFDKTGTLTCGQPRLTDIYLLDKTTPEIPVRATENHLLALAAAVERQSDHPMALAIVRAAEERSLPPATVGHARTIAGRGIEAQDEHGKSLHIGSRAYMKTLGVYNAEANRIADSLSQKGASPLYMVHDGKLVALMAITDPVRPSAVKAITALKLRNIRTAMITGDIEATAQHIAHLTGIEDVIAQVMPQEKGNAIKDLQKIHGSVAFIGDGINDAPALAQADTGLAISHGTDIAIEAADLVLTGENLMSVPNAITLSRATLTIIRENLFWAFAYNIVLLPVAAGLLYPFTGTLLSPALAAGAMAFSSIFVLCNTLRLLRFRPVGQADTPAGNG
ncbi:heavy metal translocating P-type ATPase [Bombella sp. TMW 2.2543]|uniref:Heavy metal translocating P-type ATPase n=1 Tax=Bombella pluederhausensis TaxID=2967336 RepID=A0ABT3WHM1_9PROT|nr:heavy metal translocating P-type ATPase [Bombella pluederhausensis]MCX5618605.1 heavy metal translocating P-type ATPase [Bombella pluederhausensis]